VTAAAAEVLPADAAELEGSCGVADCMAASEHVAEVGTDCIGDVGHDGGDVSMLRPVGFAVRSMLASPSGGSMQKGSRAASGAAAAPTVGSSELAAAPAHG
jgi:hypothetical protein